MIKDLLVSFRDNFKEKARNPFLGTYLLVWLIRNWELVYSIFHFDDDCKLEEKTAFIKNYYSQHNFIENLFTNLLWAFALLILTYLLLNASRFIVNLSEKQLTPIIYKITDSKSIVLKSTYEKMRVERDELQARLDQERETRSRLESRIKNLETEQGKAIEIESENKQTELRNSKLKDDIENLPDETLTSILLEKLKTKNLLKDFIELSVKIDKQEAIYNEEKPKDFFIELGLITFAKNVNYASKNYQLTKEGMDILKKYRLEKQ